MRVSLKKYIRFWFWIDLVGLAFSILLVVTYLIWGDNASAHVQNLWSNLAIEVLGVWLSVRIIDFLIQRHKSFKEIRFQQIRNLGHFENLADDVLTYSPKERDINLLEREIKYYDKRWPKRIRHFFQDEKEQINTLRSFMPEILETCRELIYKKDIESDKVDYVILKEKLKKQIFTYREVLDALIENIWEESHPDD